MERPIEAKAKQEVMTPIRDHMSHTATKQAIVEARDNVTHALESARQMVVDELPDRMYNLVEVMHALEIQGDSPLARDIPLRRSVEKM